MRILSNDIIEWFDQASSYMHNAQFESLYFSSAVTLPEIVGPITRFFEGKTVQHVELGFDNSEQSR